MSRQRIDTLRPYVFGRTAKNGRRYFNACVRGVASRTTYVSTTETREEAQAVAERFIATGERPPKAKRGPKGRRNGMPAREKKPRAISIKPRQPKPKPKPEPRPQDTTTARPKMSHEERVELLKRMWYRTA